MSNPTYTTDVGQVFVFTAQEHSGGIDERGANVLVPVDISAFTLLRIDFEDPTGSTVSVTSSSNIRVALTTDGTDGKFQVPMTHTGGYVPFTTTGVWKCQGHVTWAARKWSSEILAFVVEEGLA